MNRLFTIITLLLILSSCNKQIDVEGSWRLSFDEKTELFFPIELSFSKDTLTFIDSQNFRQVAKYSTDSDSISLTFRNGIKRAYSFNSINDSTINLSDKTFIRVDPNTLSNPKEYQLINWRTEKDFIPEDNTITIHLIKEDDTPLVVLNDVTSSLSGLPQFLNPGHGQKLEINMYVGANINLRDLYETYCWLKFNGYNSVELVTDNYSFDEFYSVTDVFDIEDSDFQKFKEKQKLPSFPPFSNSVDSITDINVTTIEDIQIGKMTGTIRYNFSIDMDIKEYLKISELLNKKGTDIKKRLTT